ncbi:NADP-dependent oxidoreductase domain-containing protein [Mycena alexandri]|uniref:NADP-dependent oxidoreductase domain-containing protein n=1 Tax=Mycena alexandri TaxID=1745969 RepID=A0AAD6XCC2_9AGAR|nr:NADP-dependent oxidoreductase domain-containing protein [Mycena alexandri]
MDKIQVPSQNSSTEHPNETMYGTQRIVKMPNSGTSCPIIGTGAWAPNVGEERTTKARQWLLSALKTGYRHIDTAYSYGTEKAVGEAIVESGINREDIFVVSKLPPNHHGRVLESIQESLDNLGFKWLDMYLMHWPVAAAYEGEDPEPLHPDGTPKAVDSPTFKETWKAMEDALRQSKCEAIGVSNFSVKNLEELMSNTRGVKPAMNQVEMHPYLAQNDLLAFCKKHDIAVVAYTPSGTDVVRNDPVIVELAAKYNATPTQIILAWHLSRNVVVIPRSTREDRQKENFNPPTLEDEDIKKIDALDRGERICNKADENGLVYGMSYEQLGW